MSQLCVELKFWLWRKKEEGETKRVCNMFYVTLPKKNADVFIQQSQQHPYPPTPHPAPAHVIQSFACKEVHCNVSSSPYSANSKSDRNYNHHANRATHRPTWLEGASPSCLIYDASLKLLGPYCPIGFKWWQFVWSPGTVSSAPLTLSCTVTKAQQQHFFTFKSAPLIFQVWVPWRPSAAV